MTILVASMCPPETADWLVPILVGMHSSKINLVIYEGDIPVTWSGLNLSLIFAGMELRIAVG